MLTISRDLFLETFRTLHECGKEVNECQVLWLSQIETPSVITAVVHSKHKSWGGGVEVDSVWITSLFRELRGSGRSIRAQVHTHPTIAFHSETDDAYPIVGTEGFVSIVIPYFASREPSFAELFITTITTDGWKELSASGALQIS